MKKVLAFLGFFVLILVGLGYVFRNQIGRKFFSPGTSELETGIVLGNLNKEKVNTGGIGIASDQPSAEVQEKMDLEIVAQDLEIPWEVAFLPDGELLVTERPGRLLKIGQNRTVIEIKGVAHVGEGGLLGMALHPNFASNNWLYLYLTSTQGEGLVNRVERYQLRDDQLTNRTVIVDNIPGAQYHDGGRLEFGPDNYLYITTGDAGDTGQAQNSDSLNGTILRVKDDGSTPEDNPFGSSVYSYGHRNVQGLAWDEQGNLWATEHGRSGVRSGFDELNLIQAGGNYGWPVIEGDKTQSGMIPPALHSGANDTWAPGDGEFIDGRIFFAGLRGEALYEANLKNQEVESVKMHFREEFGRLRAVRLGPDGYLYVTTSNRDGRGEVKAGDDKLIKINPDIFSR